MADSVKVKITGDDSDFRSKLSGVGNTAKDVFKGIIGAQVVTKGIAALTNGLSAAVTAGMNFEAAMSEVQALSGSTAEEFDLLTRTAKEYGSSTMFSATQAAEAMKYMALAGWDAQQSVDALGGVLNLAAAGGMNLAAASDMVTDYISAFGLEASNAIDVANLIAYAQANSNTSAQQLGEAYSNCATNMAAAGQTIQTTTALLMTMADVGLKGSAAGTALSAIMASLTQKMKNGAVTINGHNIALMDENGNWRDMVAILTDVNAAVDGLGSTERSAALASVFNRQSLTAVNTILQSGIGTAQEYAAALGDIDENFSADQAETMMDNLKGSITYMQSAMEGLQLTMYDSVGGIVRTAVDGATEIINEINSLMQHGFTVDGMESLLDKVFDLMADVGEQAGTIFETAFDAAIRLIPKMLPRVVQGLTSLMGAVGKQMPKLIRGVIDTLPSILENLIDFAPSLIDSVFSGVAALAEGLVARLPELVPMLIGGVVKIVPSILKGVVSVLSGIGSGLAEANYRMTSDFRADQLAASILQGYDRELVDQLLKSATEFEVTPSVTVNDPEGVQLKSIYDSIAEKLTDGMADTPEIIQGMHDEITAYYQAEIDQVNAWRDEAISNLDTSLPTEEYEAQLAQINSTADTSIAKLQTCEQQAHNFVDTYAGKPTKVVQDHLGELEGYYNDAEEIVNNINALCGEAAITVGEAAKNRAEFVTSGYSADASVNMAALAYEKNDYDSTVAELRQKQADEVAAIAAAGLDPAEAQKQIDAKNAEIEAAIAEATQAHNDRMAALLHGAMQGMAPELMSALDSADLGGVFNQIGQNMTEALQNGEIDVMDGDGIKEMLMQQIASQEISETDLATLAKNMGFDSVGDEFYTELANSMQAGLLNGNAINFAELIFSGMGDMGFGSYDYAAALITPEVAAFMQASVESGIVDSLGGVDLSTANGQIAFLTGEVGNAQAASFDSYDSGGNVSGAVKSAVEGAVTDGVNSADAQSQFTDAGSNGGEGFRKGLEGKRASIISTATSIANAAAEAIRKALDIRSPSHRLEKLGVFTGEGYRVGLDRSIRGAVKSAQNVLGLLNLSPKMDFSGITTAVGNSMQTFADIESARKIALNVNGRELATVTAPNYNSALNNYAANVIRGYGRG